MEERILYVSDLDGTLMRNDGKLSEYTVDTINELVKHGLSFTYATARSIASARTITGGLKLELPVITRNGSVLADNTTGKHIHKAIFPDTTVDLLEEFLPELPQCGFVSVFDEDKMYRVYVSCNHTPELQGYLDYYEGDPSMRQADDLHEMFSGMPGYVTIIGQKDKISPLYDRVKAYDLWECLFQKDTYRDEYWLEICPKGCTKAKTILKIKEQYGFDKLVVFGDSLNDISMFEIADEAYAVSNALDELKNIATDIIGSNEEDSVASFLKRRL